MRRIFFIILLSPFLLPVEGLVGAEVTAVVHLAGGRSEAIKVQSAIFENRNQAFIRGTVGDRGTVFKASDIWRIDFQNEVLPRGSDEYLWLRDGTRLAGRLESGSERRAIPYAEWSDIFPQLVMRNEALAGLTRSHPPPARLPVGVKENDALWTAEGDRLVGRFLRIDESHFIFRSDLGSMRIPRHRVQALMLNRDVGRPLPDPNWVLDFTNGDRVWTSLWSIDPDGKVECKIGATRRVAAGAELLRAVNVGRNVMILSRKQPEVFSTKPRLEGVRGIIVDHAPDNLPLRVGEREYAFGLFLRPDCEMEYALNDGAEHFRAELGISTQLASGGAARVSVQAGETAPHEFALKAGKAPQAIALDLRGTQRLRIRVRTDDPWGCGAHVVLGEPVLIGKEKWLADLGSEVPTGGE